MALIYIAADVTTILQALPYSGEGKVGAFKTVFIPLQPLPSAKIKQSLHISGDMAEIISTTKDNKDARVVVPFIYLFNLPVSFLQQLDGFSEEIIDY